VRRSILLVDENSRFTRSYETGVNVFWSHRLVMVNHSLLQTLAADATESVEREALPRSLAIVG
jgi:hypothetical protein